MILLFLSILSFSVKAETPEVNAPVPQENAKESSDYEVDYEEEPSVEEKVEAEVTPKKKVTDKNKKESASQGSRAEKKIAPMLKSETKSIYKKNGKALDVDPD